MFSRSCYRQEEGKQHVYWALVESYRTARRPRQRRLAHIFWFDVLIKGFRPFKMSGAITVIEQTELPRNGYERSKAANFRLYETVSLVGGTHKALGGLVGC